MFDGPLKEVQIIEVASTDGDALYGTFDVSYQGHSVGVDVGASLSVLEVGISHIVYDVEEGDQASQLVSARDLARGQTGQAFRSIHYFFAFVDSSAFDVWTSFKCRLASTVMRLHSLIDTITATYPPVALGLGRGRACYNCRRIKMAVRRGYVPTALRKVFVWVYAVHCCHTVCFREL